MRPNPPTVMNSMLRLLLAALLTASSHAEFRPWTNKSGQVAEMKLIDVAEVNGEVTGTFQMRNGRTATIRKSELSEADGRQMEDWTPPMKGEPSVFDEFLWGNLVQLEGDQLQKATFTHRPEKYYIFYYTASWCGPCRRFTPALVEWYESNKNENFEIILISSDRSAPAMEGYAKSGKMPWPLLAFDKVEAFKEEFRGKHEVRGIPSLIVCEPDGRVLGNFRSELPRLTGKVRN